MVLVYNVKGTLLYAHTSSSTFLFYHKQVLFFKPTRIRARVRLLFLEESLIFPKEPRIFLAT